MAKSKETLYGLLRYFCLLFVIFFGTLTIICSGGGGDGDDDGDDGDDDNASEYATITGTVAGTTVIAVNDAVHDSEPLFPTFDSPNHHAPHFKVIIGINADRLEVLVGRT